MKRYGLLDIEICHKPNSKDLPKKMKFIFRTEYKGDREQKRRRLCFMGDNGIAYDMQEYAVFLGMGKQAIIHRTHVEPNESEWLKPKKKGGCPKGVCTVAMSGTEEWRKMGTKTRDENMKKFKFAPYDNLIKSRKVKDEHFGCREALMNPKSSPISLGWSL